MVTARRCFKLGQSATRRIQHWRNTALLLGLGLAGLGIQGCSETAKPVTSPTGGMVHSYFGGPFSASGSSTFDRAAKHVSLSSFINTNPPNTAFVPTEILNGTFVTADTGFLNITENFAETDSGVLTPQNPPLAGAWAVEIPGAGALADFLRVSGSSSSRVLHSVPIAMAENTACQDFPKPVPFLYVTVPNSGRAAITADYGQVNISTQGSSVTFNAQPSLVASGKQPPTTVAGGCSITNLGALTAYPINSFGSPTNLDLISIATSGLLVSQFTAGFGTSGAFGGGTGVIGVAQPSGPIDPGAVVSGQYNGFMYAPLNTARANYDTTVLAASFGSHAGTSQACSMLQASVAGNHGRGAGTIAALPSANSLYGGEFRTTTGSGTVNDPTGVNGSENCDVVIDLGTQDSTTNGLFPNATIFIGTNFPPFSASNPWICSGSPCAVSFPAAAVVGKVQGQYVIFVSSSAQSTPQARLPDNLGNLIGQPVGIYLFQKAQ